MNILFVISKIGLGGASKQLCMTANALYEYGHNVLIYTMNGDKCVQKINKGVIYIPNTSIESSRFMQWVKNPFAIRNVVKSNNIDVVIAWQTNAGTYVTLATLGLNVKTIFCERSDPYMEPSSVHFFTTRLADMADGGVFQTQKAMRYYKRLSKKSVVIHNPVSEFVNNDKYVDYSTRPHKIVYLGRLTIEQKRIDLMLEAMVKIHDACPDYKLYLYGEGSGRVFLENRAKVLGIESSVIFCGLTKKAIEDIKDARLMLLSSDYEGIPNTVIEAFQAGVPVVTTDCSPGGCRVLINDGKNGFIVPFRDVNALAKKAVELLSDESLAKKFIFNSYEKLKEFEPKRIFDKWNAYILKLVSA